MPASTPDGGRPWLDTTRGLGYRYTLDFSKTLAETYAMSDTTTYSRRSNGIAYLMQHGNVAVPCSRYGYDTEECAPIAWRVAYLIARESGYPITVDLLDHVMSLVVNDHDDVAYLVNNYGHGHYR